MKTKEELPVCPVATAVSLMDFGLTDLGKEMLPIIDALADFGNYYKSIVE